MKYIWYLPKKVNFLYLTSPAPCMTKTLSLSFLPVILRDANTPAAATAAVPVGYYNKVVQEPHYNKVVQEPHQQNW